MIFLLFINVIVIKTNRYNFHTFINNMGTQLSTINNLCVGDRKCIHSDNSTSTSTKPILSEFGLFGKALYQEKKIENEKVVTLFDTRDTVYIKKNKKRKRKKGESNNSKPIWGTIESIKYNKKLNMV